MRNVGNQLQYVEMKYAKMKKYTVEILKMNKK